MPEIKVSNILGEVLVLKCVKFNWPNNVKLLLCSLIYISQNNYFIMLNFYTIVLLWQIFTAKTIKRKTLPTKNILNATFF